MFRMMLSGDWELTRDRLPIARPILRHMADMFHKLECDVFIGTGDYMAEFVPDTTAAMHDFAKWIGAPIWLVLGNHDYNVPGINKIRAIFGDGDGVDVISTPHVIHSVDDMMPGANTLCHIAFMPAPNRAAFGAARGAENNVVRNAALTDALGNAIKTLRMSVPDGELEHTILIGHGTPAGAVFPSGISSRGLTWEFPGAMLADCGRCAFGHIHTPYTMDGGRIIGVGGIAPWTHGDRAALYYAVVITVDDDGCMSHEWIALPRVMHNMEFTVDEHESIIFQYDCDSMKPAGVVTAELSFGGVNLYDAAELARGFHDIIGNRLGWDWDDGESIALKINFKMTAERLAALPSNDDIVQHFNRQFYANIRITRERTDVAIQSRIASDHKRMSLTELFREWMIATERPVDTAAFDAVSGVISREYSHEFGDGHFGIEPVTLRINNFRQWGTAAIDFADWNGAVAITGRNALGKSNLIESILFALFKRTPSSSGLIADEINVNATDATVEFEFMAGGDHYRVCRALKRTKRGATCKTEFLRANTDAAGLISDPTWQPMAETAADIDREIVAIVGSYEFVISTFFGTQKDIDRLIDATPAETHQLMLESMALQRFEPMRDRAAEIVRAMQAECDAAKLRVEFINAELANAIERANAMRSGADIDIELGNESANIEITHGHIDNAESQRRDALVQMAESRAAMKRIDDLRAELSNVDKGIASVESEIKRRVQTVEITRAELAHISDIPEPVAELEKRQSEMIERRHAIENVMVSLQNKYNEHWRHKESYNAQITSAHGEIAAIDNKIAAIDAAERPDVPCGDLRMDDAVAVVINANNVVTLNDTMKSHCPAYRLMIDAGRRESLMAERNNWNNTVNMASDEMIRAGDAARAVDDRVIETRRDYSELIQSINDMERQIAAARHNESIRERIDAEYERIDELNDISRERNIRRVELLDEIATIDAGPGIAKRIADIDAAINSMDFVIRQRNAELDKSRTRIIELERQKAEHDSVMESIARMQKQRGAAQHDAQSCSDDVMAYTLISAAFSANGGIPYLIMERMVGSITAETNRILNMCNTEITISINTVTETQAGEARNRVEIRFVDERGDHPLAAASGYQRAAIGMALRAAFTRIGSEFWGMMPAFFVQDEGWDRFHASARPIAGALIGELAAISRRFIYITHIDELAEFADVRINVSGDRGYSTFERIA